MLHLECPTERLLEACAVVHFVAERIRQRTINNREEQRPWTEERFRRRAETEDGEREREERECERERGEERERERERREEREGEGERGRGTPQWLTVTS